MRHAVVIGGSPGAGKTTLARALARSLDADWISGDDLVTAVRSATTPDTHPALHTIRVVGHTEYFTTRSRDQIERDALALFDATAPIVHGVLQIRHHGSRSTVIDSWATTPRHVGDLGMPAITPVWIEIDPTALRAREEANPEFFGRSQDPARMLETFMHRSLWHQARILEQASELGHLIIRQPGKRPTEALVDEVLQHLGLDPHNSQDVGSAGS